MILVFSDFLLRSSVKLANLFQVRLGINVYGEPFNLKHNVFVGTYLRCSQEATVWNNCYMQIIWAQSSMYNVWSVMCEQISANPVYIIPDVYINHTYTIFYMYFLSWGLCPYTFIGEYCLLVHVLKYSDVYLVNLCVLGTIPENPAIVLDSKKSLQDPFNLHTFIDSKRQDLEEKGQVNLFGDNSQFQVKITNNMEIHLKVK